MKPHDFKYNNQIKVSVCVVTFNHENYLDECLKSIVGQETNFKFKVLVSDDCSTDGTRDIISRYAQKYPEIVAPVFREKNIGAFKNFVATHNMAQGEYVCHCDGDDRWLPGKLQAQADFLDANPDFSTVWHRVNFFNDSGQFYAGDRYDYSMFKNGIVTLSCTIRLGSVATHSSVMYRASSRKTRNPNFDALDMFYAWEFLSDGNGKILDQTLGEYRVASKNAVTRNSGSKIKRMYSHHAYFYYLKFPNLRKDVFLFAIINFFIDLKNLRSSTKDFAILMFRTISFVSPYSIYETFLHSKRLGIPNLRCRV